MKKQNGITLVDTIILVIILCVALFFWAQYTFNNHPQYRPMCGTNLKGLGTAMQVYANDYDGRCPQLRGTGPWSKELGFAYDMSKPDFSPQGAQGNTPRTVTASWYLLVREVDVSPSSFICPQSNQKAFGGKHPKYEDLIQFWDFGPNPYAHVSYAMHNPYSRFPASVYAKKEGFSSFAVAADMNPWFKDGDIQPPGPSGTSPQIITLTDKVTWLLGMAPFHVIGEKTKTPEGQNVLYADGHTSYETQPNIGVSNDNIYTFWSTDDNPTDQDKQGGTAPTGRTPENDAKSEEDSFLVL